MPPTLKIEQDFIIMKFLSSQNKGTQYTYKCFFKKILEFTATKGLMTGQQILDDKKADTDSHWEQWVIEFKQWMKQQKNSKGRFYSDNAIKGAINPLRTFFKDNRTPLVFVSSELHKLNKRAQRVEKDFKLTNETISKMTFVGDLREKYIVLAGKSFGLRASDFITLTYGTFRPLNLDQEPPISIEIVQTIKEGVDAHPFIDADTLPIIKAYLESNRNKPNNERMIKIQEEELSTIIQNLAKKANIELGDQRLRFHCFRKYLCDILATVATDNKWKQIIGKANSEEPYVSDSYLREIYLKAMKYTTCINTNGTGKVSKLSEQINELTIKDEKNDKIINALVQDSTKKDLELEKQNQKINELNNQVKNVENKVFPNPHNRDQLSLWKELHEEIEGEKQWRKDHQKEIEHLKEQMPYWNEKVEDTGGLTYLDLEIEQQYKDDPKTQIHNLQQRILELEKALKELIEKFEIIQKDKETKQPTN